MYGKFNQDSRSGVSVCVLVRNLYYEKLKGGQVAASANLFGLRNYEITPSGLMLPSEIKKFSRKLWRHAASLDFSLDKYLNIVPFFTDVYMAQ